MKWFRCVAAALCVGAALSIYAGPDEDYIAIYQLIEEGDQLMAVSNTVQAGARFTEAEQALKKFKATYPFWNDKTVDFRLQYVSERLKKLGPAPRPATTPAVAPVQTPVDPTVELRQSIAQLQEERNVLNAKLKEALAAQPAAVDPRELQKAEAQINSLQKEKELLRVALEQEQAKTAKAADKSGLEQAQKENAALRAQLAAGAAPVAASEREVAAARESARTNALAVTALQVALNDMRQERDAVLARAAAASARADAKPAGAEAAEKIKQLEKERDELQKRLSAANREVADARVKPAKGGTDDTERRLAILRARLEVLEARKVPYTPEELALFKQGPLALKAPSEKKEAKRKELPPGAGLIIAEAQRAFASKQLDVAEAKFKQILAMDEKNVFTLGNLALIQLEQNRLSDAEATLMRAQALEPDDAFLTSNLGILRFRQGKFDEAVDLLSRAVDLNPRNAEAYNFLGMALGEKGLRQQSETALRKAVELNPNYAQAHHNLAVIYAAQQPPFRELAKYHYEKALALRHPADPEFEKMLNKKP